MGWSSPTDRRRVEGATTTDASGSRRHPLPQPASAVQLWARALTRAAGPLVALVAGQPPGLGFGAGVDDDRPRHVILAPAILPAPRAERPQAALAPAPVRRRAAWGVDMDRRFCFGGHSIFDARFYGAGEAGIATIQRCNRSQPPDRSGLENRKGRQALGGSNPSPSANCRWHTGRFGEPRVRDDWTAPNWTVMVDRALIWSGSVRGLDFVPPGHPLAGARHIAERSVARHGSASGSRDMPMVTASGVADNNRVRARASARVWPGRPRNPGPTREALVEQRAWISRAGMYRSASWTM